MAETRIQSLRRIAGRKGQITKLINNIRDAMSTCEERSDIRTLQQRLEEYRDVYVDEVLNYCEELKDENKDEVTSAKEKEIEQIDERINEVNNEIKEYSKKSEVNDSINKADVSEELIHLERLNLPKFSGTDYFYWKSIFDVTVLAQRWSDKTKMLRLISCLEGEAYELIRLYPIADASFHVALERLESEYGGRKRMVSEAIKNVRKGKIVCEEDIKEIRTFTSVLESTRIVYKDQATELDGEGPLFHCARERLSPGLLRQYLQWCNTKNVSESFVSLIDFLTQWVKILKESKPDFLKSKRSVMSNYVQSQGSKERGVGSGSSFQVRCVWHKKVKNVESPHYLNACDEFKSLKVEQRRDFVFKNKLCFLCLKGNHTAKKCNNPRWECRSCEKGNRHHFLLHVNRNEEQHETTSLESNNCQVRNAKISLQTIPVLISHGDRKIKINALLDPGSNTSFISKTVADELQLSTSNHEIRYLNTITSNDQSISVSRVCLTIESVDGKVQRKENVLALAEILLKSEPLDWQKLKLNWTHLAKVPFPKLSDRNRHEMLIGADLAYYHRCYKEIKGRGTAPIAKLTPLGWTALGPAALKGSSCTEAMDVHLCEFEDLNALVQAQWKLDSLGITDDNLKQESAEEKAAVKILDKSLMFKDGRYFAPMLWKNNSPTLVNNFEAVERRTNNMERRISKNNDLFESCKQVIRSYVQKGYIYEIAYDKRFERAFYIPYFPIVKKDRATTKCRLVFDCAAKYLGSSLNDQIVTGPKLQNDIIDVMLRFRRYRYAVIGDISEMYLQIGLTPEDRKFCRFVFNNKVYEWSRLIFGRSDAPFIALRVIRNHALKFKDQYGETVESIMESMYIDDLCDSRDEPSRVHDVVQQSTEIFAGASMKICKWITNCREVLSTIPSDLRASGVTHILDDQLPATKTLGLTWDVCRDEICYTVNEVTDFTKEPCTKRNILRSNARIFDPLGYLDPILITSKILFQRVWAAGTDWDELAPDTIKQEWLHWYQQVKQLGSIRIPRHLGISLSDEFQLHVFCDASKQAYSATIYVRSKSKDRVTSRLVISKSRVTPLKSRTIPQLELMGATIATRLARRVCRVLRFDLTSVVFWTDSLNVLFWIKKPAKFFKPFVSNRVGEIQQATDSIQWRHCPTNLNPADIPTRTSSVVALRDNSLWWNGPEFLVKEEEQWPPKLVKIEDVNIEEKCERSTMQVNFVTICEDDFLLNPARWSTKRKLLKRLAYVLRFINNLKRAPNERSFEDGLLPEEWREAEDTLIRMCQLEAFNAEVKSLTIKVSEDSARFGN